MDALSERRRLISTSAFRGHASSLGRRGEGGFYWQTSSVGDLAGVSRLKARRRLSRSFKLTKSISLVGLCDHGVGGWFDLAFGHVDGKIVLIVVQLKCWGW